MEKKRMIIKSQLFTGYLKFDFDKLVFNFRKITFRLSETPFRLTELLKAELCVRNQH